MKRLWRWLQAHPYGLSIAFAVQWIVTTVLYGVFLKLHQEHPASFWYEFLAGIFENLQSEAFQVLALIVLSAYLIHRGSGQSKDGDDEMREQLDRIEQELLPAWKKRGDG